MSIEIRPGPLPRLWRDFDTSDDQVFLSDKVSQQTARHAHNRLQSLAPPKYGDAKDVVQEERIQTDNLIQRIEQTPARCSHMTRTLLEPRLLERDKVSCCINKELRYTDLVMEMETRILRSYS